MTGATNRRALVLALSAAVLCLVVIGFLLTRSRDEATPVPTTAPTSDPATTASTTATGDGGLAAPVVVANPTTGAVAFSWSYSAATSTDTYRVHVGPSADEAQIADPVTLTRATYTVKSPSGGQVCLLAAVVRDGEISATSAAACGTAR